MDQLEEYKKIFSERLDDLAEHEVVKMLAARVGREPKQLVRYVVTGAFLSMLLLAFNKLVVSVFCALIPVYMSLKALVHNDPAGTRLCLHYWVIYAIFTTVEVVMYPVLYFVPMWSLVRCVLLFSVYSPHFNTGGQIINMIMPFFTTYERKVDFFLQKLPGGLTTHVTMSDHKKDDEKHTSKDGWIDFKPSEVEAK